MSALYKHGNATIQGNLTPMIDMIFLLIVFFVLVSRIVDRERVEMNLPQPTPALTLPMDDEHRVIINVLPGVGGEIRGYRVGGTEFSSTPTGLAELTQRLAGVYRGNPQVNVNIRADRGTHYERVEPILRAVSTAARASGSPAATARVNLVVVKEGATP
jgi:biopolymer transport protein ExbD